MFGDGEVEKRVGGGMKWVGRAGNEIPVRIR